MNPALHLPPAVLAVLVAALARLTLVSLRILPATLALPYLGGTVLPTQARVPVLVVLSIGVAPWLLDAPPAAPPITALFAAACAREVAIGLVIALVLGAPFFALEQGGRLLDAARGANVAEVIAPESGARSSPLSELLRWTFGVVFLASGGLRATVRVVASSLAALPPDPTGLAHIPTAHLVDVAARWTADALAAGLTLVSAGLLALVALEVLLAFASRLSPPIAQSNAALPARALAPLIALALTVAVWTGAARDFAANAIAAASAVAR